jgi:hypothetical protein
MRASADPPSEVGRRIALALVLLSTALTSCGSSEQEKAAEVVHAFEDALSDDRPADACELMSEAGRRLLVSNVRGDSAQNEGRPIRGCRDAAAAISGGERAVVANVTLDGPDRATVSLEVPGSDDPDAGGSVEAVKEDGKWRIGTTF